jgi:hypothetical protein
MRARIKAGPLQKRAFCALVATVSATFTTQLPALHLLGGPGGAGRAVSAALDLHPR